MITKKQFIKTIIYSILLSFIFMIIMSAGIKKQDCYVPWNENSPRWSEEKYTYFGFGSCSPANVADDIGVIGYPYWFYGTGGIDGGPHYNMSGLIYNFLIYYGVSFFVLYIFFLIKNKRKSKH